VSAGPRQESGPCDRANNAEEKKKKKERKKKPLGNVLEGNEK
jgi:hypothetical protein